MRSKSFAALVLVLSTTLLAHAQSTQRKFPYQAIVEGDGEYVRSGPGSSFYPTDKLRKGEKVTVHRHDPGGWCMISPPPGSFSWVRADHVQKSGDDRGVLKANNVVVHVGSSLNIEEFTTIQGNLSKKDAVQILGEKSFNFDDGPRLMYKISPVRREWRWIQTKSIIPADAIQPDPFPGEQNPRKRKSEPVADQLDPEPEAAFAQPISTGETTSEIITQGPRSRAPGSSANAEDDATQFKDQLDEIDQQFRTMIKLEPTSWNLRDIQQQYLQLENEATQPTQSRTIALRLDAVSRYEKTQSDYLNFLKLSEEAKQRDAKLAAIQKQNEEAIQGLNGQTPQIQPQPSPSSIAGPTPTAGPVIASTGNPPAPADSARPPQPAFAGAGVVTPMARTFPGGPQYALVAPDGKLLCYLIPNPGIDLKPSVNQPVGVIGDRSFRQDWGSDAIVVRGVQPVQLRASR